MTPLERTVDFLRSIGLVLIEEEGVTGFLGSVRIVDGQLHYDPTRALPSDLLHEAGHLAVIPARYRAAAGDNVDDIIARMCEDVSTLVETNPEIDFDGIEIRGVMQSGETEATAWAFAAGRVAGLPDDTIILDKDYEGEGANVREGLALNAYLGINGLVAGGMCASVRSYPQLIRWLQI